QVQYHVHVPRVVRRVLLRQDRHLQHHLLPDRVVRRLQVVQHLLHDLLRVRPVAHRVQQIDRLLPHRHVLLHLHRQDHHLLVLFDRFVRKLGRRQMAHRLQRQVAQVRLAVAQELAQLIARPHQQARLAVVVYDQIDRLEQDRVLRVRVLHLLALWRLLRLVQNRLQTLVQPTAHARILRRRVVVLQQAQQLHRQPRRRHKVVRVVLQIRVRSGHDAGQARHGQADAALVLFRVFLDQRIDQAGRRRYHAHMLIVQQMDDPAGPLAARDDVRAGAEQPQQAQRGRLLHHVHRVARHEQLRDFVRERFRHILAADVGDALQRQIDVDGIARLQIVLDALDDQLDQIAVRVHQHRDEQIADLFLRVFVGGQQIDRLHVAEIDVMAEQKDEQQLAHVLLLLVAVQRFVPFKFAPNVGQLLVDALDFRLFAFAVPDVRYEHGQSAHSIPTYRCHLGCGCFPPLYPAGDSLRLFHTQLNYTASTIPSPPVHTHAHARTHPG
uniref:Uncharacterized protein n=1 Tax=Anopheles quadriannulatus TaxID=34691 RepID=A0A182XS43_ANOQN